MVHHPSEIVTRQTCLPSSVNLPQGKFLPRVPITIGYGKRQYSCCLQNKASVSTCLFSWCAIQAKSLRGKLVCRRASICRKANSCRGTPIAEGYGKRQYSVFLHRISGCCLAVRSHNLRLWETAIFRISSPNFRMLPCRTFP